ncbi:hypothetical protein BpHYR1_048568 [Brachionus plicatilis]|uniref:Uncharacterized protein n=1 Tax=Brachionus plicatilis TaxID=10195 RepID=A0A3M7PWL6_BRAPC|nr:hypothetical protein BpHYR1_048568 [Brachionus plicatilis]
MALLNSIEYARHIRLSSSFFDFNNSVQTTAVAAVRSSLFAAPTRSSHPTDPSNQPTVERYKKKNIFLFLDVLRNLRFLRTKNFLNVGQCEILVQKLQYKKAIFAQLENKL